ncbi:Benzoate 1,2-dioxygenase electron transfer component [Pigmentiphaga humi]|uniref:Benzoate 1,2-dioxygenase electron transfer component n=1 Tax=Pigmentiphaga humi TaxID=2478468 RepID=A0A3P4AWK5_9BURK|nr:2Fe-2S iron-sulfur cluster binding domain-containing protein [Pigmentiphaga humi]VCU68413.1 Benzoate 1,2-dioxygenase electron transfer component [Pigmentiphaga humi]
MHDITAIFEDGRTVRFSARPGEVVYQAAYRASVQLAHDCLEGACGECKAWCTAGEFELDDYSDEALSRDERSQGQTLLCKMLPRSSCVVELPYPSGFQAGSAPASIEARLADIERVSSTVVRTRLETAQPLDFLPGQYANLSVPGAGVSRAYSFANPPGRNLLEFFHKLVPEGAMSTYLAQRAAAGDALELTPPSGHFYLRGNGRPLLMIAGGTGLAPFLSMLGQLARRPEAAPPIRLLVGANAAAEFFADEQLAELARALPLEIERIAVSGEGWAGATGHVTGLLRDDMLRDAPDVYLCGPPPMIEACAGWLAARDVDRRRVRAEKFLPSA